MTLREELNKLKRQADALQKSIDEYEVLVKKIDKPMWHEGDGYTGYRWRSVWRDAQDKSTTEAIFDAFTVIFELRQQPGSGQMCASGFGFFVSSSGQIGYTDLSDQFALSPPFPEQSLAIKARDHVGTERVIKAYRTLSGIEWKSNTAP